MRQVSKREMAEFLKAHGYEPIRTKGSHVIYSDGNGVVSVPSVTLKAVVANRLIKEITKAKSS